MPKTGLGLVIGLAAAVLIVHCHQRVEEMRSREKARDEPTTGEVYLVEVVSWTTPGYVIVFVVPAAEQQTKPGQKSLKHGEVELLNERMFSDSYPELVPLEIHRVVRSVIILAGAKRHVLALIDGRKQDGTKDEAPFHAPDDGVLVSFCSPVPATSERSHTIIIFPSRAAQIREDAR
ncbi:hypothetical protein EDB19DRAFT_1829176 [Suillus lakei]|nr:hypothetical protein EDB19DRAFT_1829744 [Suillus lakei]KAG1738560.1 hypothetical protein EDB19DRAFT_1829176 [Suillus lakei]